MPERERLHEAVTERQQPKLAVARHDQLRGQRPARRAGGAPLEPVGRQNPQIEQHALGIETVAFDGAAPAARQRHRQSPGLDQASDAKCSDDNERDTEAHAAWNDHAAP